MSIINISKFETAMEENEEWLKNNIDEFKAKASSPMNNTDSPLNPNKYISSYNQPSSDIIKWTLLKSPDFHSHASKSTKNISSITL